MEHQTIRPVAPFDFDLTLGVYASFREQSVETHSPGCFQRVLSAYNTQYLATAASVGTVDRPEVSVSITPDPDAQSLSTVVGRLEWMMGADSGLAPFYEAAHELDPVLFGITRQLYGLKPPRTPSVFEALVVAITEQQTSLAAASAVRGRLVRRYGEAVHAGGSHHYAFPTPESLAGARRDDLRSLGLSHLKAECISTVAQKVAEGQIALESLSGSPLDAVLQVLAPLKGIGRWTVEYTVCRGMGRYDALPASDTVLRAAVTRFYGGGSGVTERNVRATLDPLGEYRGCAAFYLIFAYAFEKYGKDPRVGQRSFGLEV